MNTLTPLNSTEEAAQAIFDWFKKPEAVFGFDNDKSVCVYRGNENPQSNVRCAFGCLIPNEIYKEAMGLTVNPDNPRGIEGKLVRDLFEHNSTVAMKMYFANVDMGFLNLAQELHDNHAHMKNSVAHFLAQFCVMCKTKYDIDIYFDFDPIN